MSSWKWQPYGLDLNVLIKQKGTVNDFIKTFLLNPIISFFMHCSIILCITATLDKEMQVIYAAMAKSIYVFWINDGGQYNSMTISWGYAWDAPVASHNRQGWLDFGCSCDDVLQVTGPVCSSAVGSQYNIIRQCLDSEPHHWNWTNDYVYMGMAINIIEWLMPLGARPPSIKNVNKILWRNVCIL